jgi:hypothetical protein
LATKSVAIGVLDAVVVATSESDERDTLTRPPMRDAGSRPSAIQR